MRYHFQHLTGTLIESQKRYQGYGGGIAATLHHEIWLKESNGKETHIHLIDMNIPVRKGHLLHVVFFENRPVAIINFNTSECFNFEPTAHIVPASSGQLYPSFPELLSFRDMSIVLITMFAIASILKPWLALPLLLAIVAFVIYRNRAQPTPEIVIHNDLHFCVEEQIRSVMSGQRDVPA